MNSDVEMVDQSGNPKVAILDAGAQYGKVDVFFYLFKILMIVEDFLLAFNSRLRKYAFLCVVFHNAF